MMMFHPPDASDELEGHKLLKPFTSFMVVRGSKMRVTRSMGYIIMTILFIFVVFYIMVMNHAFGKGKLFCRLVPILA
jgi:hypothetical protein